MEASRKTVSVKVKEWREEKEKKDRDKEDELVIFYKILKDIFKICSIHFSLFILC